MAPASRATQVPLATAKNELSALVDRVEHGEAITITRRGVPVVRLVQHQPCADSAHTREAVVDAALSRLQTLRAALVLEGDLRQIAREGLD